MWQCHTQSLWLQKKKGICQSGWRQSHCRFSWNWSQGSALWCIFTLLKQWSWEGVGCVRHSLCPGNFGNDLWGKDFIIWTSRHATYNSLCITGLKARRKKTEEKKKKNKLPSSKVWWLQLFSQQICWSSSKIRAINSHTVTAKNTLVPQTVLQLLGIHKKLKLSNY